MPKIGDLIVSEDVLTLNEQLHDMGKAVSIPASKYHNTQTDLDGLRFASGHEAAEMSKLKMLEQKHLIFGLRFQVRFPLPGGNVYVADATYLELRDGQLQPVVADAKGMRTKEYLIKKRAFKAHYGMEITEL